jgi:hypothetical protein
MVEVHATDQHAEGPEVPVGHGLRSVIAHSRPRTSSVKKVAKNTSQFRPPKRKPERWSPAPRQFEPPEAHGGSARVSQRVVVAVHVLISDVIELSD